MTSTNTSTPQADRHTRVFDLPQALHEGSTPNSPAAVTEALLPEIKESFWLLVSSNAVIDGQDKQVLRMILERTAPSGTLVALNVDWQPQRWGLPPNSPPSAEVLRRVLPLAQAAQLIRCTSEEAEDFFESTDPVQVHHTFPQQPAVLISNSAGGLSWCIGGRRGRMDPLMVCDHQAFLAQLLEDLSTHPQLLGSAGPGVDAIADPNSLAEQLLTAGVASADPDRMRD